MIVKGLLSVLCPHKSRFREWLLSRFAEAILTIAVGRVARKRSFGYTRRTKVKIGLRFLAARPVYVLRCMESLGPIDSSCDQWTD